MRKECHSYDASTVTQARASAIGLQYCSGICYLSPAARAGMAQRLDDVFHQPQAAVAVQRQDRSGWNCTASMGNSRWRTPMMTPSSLSAVTSRHAGQLFANREQGMIAAYAEFFRQTFENTHAAMVLPATACRAWDNPARPARRRTPPPCPANPGTRQTPEFRAWRRAEPARARRNPPAARARRDQDQRRRQLLDHLQREARAIGDHFRAGLARVIRQRVDEAIFVIHQQQPNAAGLLPLRGAYSARHRGFGIQRAEEAGGFQMAFAIFAGGDRNRRAASRRRYTRPRHRADEPCGW